MSLGPDMTRTGGKNVPDKLVVLKLSWVLVLLLLAFKIGFRIVCSYVGEAQISEAH